MLLSMVEENTFLANVKFPDSGQYTVRLQDDDWAVLINEVKVARTVYDRGTPIPSYVNLSAGTYTVRKSAWRTLLIIQIFFTITLLVLHLELTFLHKLLLDHLLGL